MKCVNRVLTLIFFGLALTACGQSGPLYLPPPPAKTPAQLSGSPRITSPQTQTSQIAPGHQLNQTHDTTSVFQNPANTDDSSDAGDDVTD
jgi:predicted small lipoprotein YifL